MKLSRLQLTGHDEAEDPIEVRFHPDIAILDLDRAGSMRIRLALEALFRGRSDFGRTFVTVDEIELEISSELAQHLGHHLDERSRILDTTTRRGDPGVTGSVAAIALRAALEMLRAVTSQLDHRTVDATLAAVLADQTRLETEAQVKVMEAVGKQANAQVALGKIAQWRASIGPLHERSTEARRKARRRLSGPLAYRRFAKLRDQEMESLEKVEFASFEEFQQHADAQEARYQQELKRADEEHRRAERYHESLRNRTCETSEARVLAAQEFALRLRLRQFAEPEALSTANQNALGQALTIMAKDGAGLADTDSENLLQRSLKWLASTESNSLRQDLGHSILAHAEPVPAVGTIPLIIDGLLDGVEPIAAARALQALDPYVGTVQIVSLRYDPAIARWAHGHGILQDA